MGIYKDTTKVLSIGLFSLVLAKSWAQDPEWAETWHARTSDPIPNTFFQAITNGKESLILGNKGEILLKQGNQFIKSRLPFDFGSVVDGAFVTDTWYVAANVSLPEEYSIYKSVDGIHWEKVYQHDSNITLFFATEIEREPYFHLNSHSGYYYSHDISDWTELHQFPGIGQRCFGGGTPYMFCWETSLISFFSLNDKIEIEFHDVYIGSNRPPIGQPGPEPEPEILHYTYERGRNWLRNTEKISEPIPQIGGLGYVYATSETLPSLNFRKLYEISLVDLDAFSNTSNILYSANKNDGNIYQYDPHSGWNLILDSELESSVFLKAFWIENGKLLALSNHSEVLEFDPESGIEDWSQIYSQPENESQDRTGFRNVIFSNGSYFAIKRSGLIYKSLTGEQWIPDTNPFFSISSENSPFRSASLHLAGNHLIAHDSISGDFALSSEGSNWSQFNAVNASSISWIQNKFVRVLDNESGTSELFTSVDGSQWTKRLEYERFEKNSRGRITSNGSFAVYNGGISYHTFLTFDGGINWFWNSENWRVKYAPTLNIFYRKTGDNQFEFTEDGRTWLPYSGGDDFLLELDLAYGWGSLVSIHKGQMIQSLENPSLQPGTMANLSTRSISENGENVQIGGFVIDGSQPKTLLIRGIGPGIEQYGVANYMSDPTIELYHDGQIIQSNDDWDDSEDASSIVQAAQQTGAFELKPGSTDAATLVTLDPGAYGFIVKGKEQGGVALAEMYDLDTTTGGLFNMSSRSLVRSGEEIAIGGLIVSGERPVRIIARGIGPGLASQGIENPLEDPVLEVYRNGEVFFSNNGLTDNSFENQKVLALSEAMNLIPAKKEDTALYLALPPGQYGFFLRSESSTEGVGLIEVYKVPQELANQN